MRKSRLIAASALGIVAALTMSGCAASNDAGDAADQTLTIWAMNGDLSTTTIDAINAEFEKETGAKVDVQVQEWDDIITKVTTALATSSAPDVLDLGNTQVPIYAANGGLLDLTAYKDDLEQGQTWLGGLEEPATQNGALYGIPSFAGDRAVIYNKTMWAAAGITEPPTTYAEFTADLDKIAAANTSPDFSAFYYPAKYDFAPLGFVWDAGGEIATEKDGTWTAGFSSPEAQKGLEQFKEFQNKYSIASSQGVNENDPEQAQILADGRASAILGISSEVDAIKAANPELTDDDLGTFPFPGVSGKNQPVMLGGSVWGVAAKSQKADLAVKWIKIAASPDIQSKYVYGTDKWIPNSVEAIQAARDSGTMPPLTAGFFEAAIISNATPAAANWPTIENDLTLRDFFSYVASGSKSTKQAAEEFDAHIESVLNK
jgi:N,N'-diacetylchitobiose transport system substrate-binding protein